MSNSVTKLQLKTGKGTIDPAVIHNAEKIMEEIDIDFAPMAQDYLYVVVITLRDLDNNKINKRDAHRKITKAIMELKANSKIFGYGLLGDLSGVLLNLIDNSDDLDPDLIKIINAHYKTGTVIINDRMTGDGGQIGKVIFKEFQAACARYTDKQQKLR